MRPRQLETPDDAIGHTLGALARPWQTLDVEAKDLSTMIEDLIMPYRPALGRSVRRRR